MRKTIIYFLAIKLILIVSCDGQNDKKPDLNLNNYNYEESVLSEDEMKETTEKAIKLIQERNYEKVRDLFAEDISKNITKNQLAKLVNHLNLLFRNEGIPTGNENIVPALQASINGNDTIFVNKIMYNYQPTKEEPYPKVLSFSFLKKYGTKQLAGINIGTDGQKNIKPTIEKLNNFAFNSNEINQFRIYFDEGKNRKTKFKNKIGFFAIEGDINTLNESGLTPILESIFDDLKKSKFEKVEIFNSSFNRGDSPSFIQLDVSLKNKPYGVFLYLPIEDDGIYSDKIILMQMEYANLGYKYILNQKDYPKIIKEFPKIGKLKLEKFYEENP